MGEGNRCEEPKWWREDRQGSGWAVLKEPLERQGALPHTNNQCCDGGIRQYSDSMTTQHALKPLRLESRLLEARPGASGTQGLVSTHAACSMPTGPCSEVCKTDSGCWVQLYAHISMGLLRDLRFILEIVTVLRVMLNVCIVPLRLL